MVIKQCMGEGDKCKGRWRHVLTESHQHGAVVRPTVQSWGPRISTILVIKSIYSTHLLKAGDTVPSSETGAQTSHSHVHSMNISLRSLKYPWVAVIVHPSVPGCSWGILLSFPKTNWELHELWGPFPPSSPYPRTNLSPSTHHPNISLVPFKIFPTSNPPTPSVSCGIIPVCLSVGPPGQPSALQAPGLSREKVGEPCWDFRRRRHRRRAHFAATPHRYSGCPTLCWRASSTEFSCIKNCTCQRCKTNDDGNNVREHPLNIWEGWIHEPLLSRRTRGT